MTHSDMLYRLDISPFYFYEPLLLQIFVPWKFIRTEAFPCLRSLLQSTATQIIISINIFICFIVYRNNMCFYRLCLFQILYSGYLGFPAPSPGPRLQFVFDGPGPKFVFHGPSPQFVFTGPGLQFVFTCSSFYS